MDLANVRPLVEGNTAFAVDLFNQLRGEQGNLIVSPFSISTALAMTEAGARGETAEQMRRTLHLPREERHAMFAALLEDLRDRTAEGTVRLEIANALFQQSGASFEPAFLELVAARYGGEARELDFAGATEQARQTINEWTERQTENRIQDLFPPGTIDPSTVLALVNAVYFKGAWAARFDPAQTVEAPFRTADGGSTPVRMMRRTGQYRYAESPEAQVLSMPYAGADLSMLVVLPRDPAGLAAIESSLSQARLDGWIGALAERPVIVELPKFTYSTRFNLNQTLAAMGMGLAFSDRADFSGMSRMQNLTISDVVHKAFVEVTEEGTEAAAATGVTMRPTSMPQERPKEVLFRADHPFLFFIRDQRTGSILFVGRVANPAR